MSEIVITTDSVAQIAPELAQTSGVGVIPFSIIIEGKSHTDGVDISPAQLYQRMRTEDILPKTSQPSMGEYLQFFKKFIEKGARTIIYLPVSAVLSGAFSTASKAAHLIGQEHPGTTVEVVDTKTATISQGFLALQAAQAARAGASLQQILELIQQTRPKVGFVAMFETLYYLERGGRIGKAAYLAGSLVNIKPLITIGDDGVVTPMGNLRGNKKCTGKLVDCLAETLNGRRLAKLAVMHADNEEKLVELKQIAQERFQIEEILVTEFTPVMGAHAGPGVLGLGYLLE